MSLLQNSNAIPQLGGYDLTDSVRFRSASSAYLSRTPSGTGTSRKTMTLSWWFKKSFVNTSDKAIFSVGSNQFVVKFNSGASADKLQVYDYTGAFQLNLQTNQVFRDPSAWYHIVIQLDSTQATASNRAKLYINGEQVTSFASTTYPSLNYDYQLNYNIQHNIGNESGSTNYFDGYITEFNFVDGQQLTPSDFGEYDEDTGVWKPKRYTGTHGTNGFYLPMKATTQAEGFNTVTYTGTGSDDTKITDVGFQPDFVWIKDRSNARDSVLFDSVRGATNYLRSSTTGAEGTASDTLKSFDSNGFTLGTNVANNGSAETYVAWCWEAGGTASSNTDGTITSQVSANTAKGFSVVTYSGNSTAGATVGHGLGAAPDFVVVKTTNVTGKWTCYHSALGNTKYVEWSSTIAGTTGSTVWNNTSPTSSVFSLGTYGNVNGGYNYVAYCFRSIAGYSKFGTYTGTGSAGNSITGLGFRPAFLMIKRTDSTGNWIMLDNTRSPDNSPGEYLLADSSNAEATTTIADLDSDGFTINATGSGTNASGGTYIYMAFADTRDFQWNFDASGNKNNWTPTNINSNASSETTYDIMSDVPTLTDEDTGNFCTLNPTTCNEGTISNGNLTIDHNGSTGKFYLGTMGISSGKWYFEAKVLNMSSNSRHTIGFCKAHESFQSFQTYMGGSSSTYYCLFYSGAQYEGTTIARTISSLAQPASGTIINVAIDVDNNKVFFGKNGTWQNSGNPVTGTGQCINLAANTEWVLATGAADNSSNSTHNNDWDFNFGQQPFAYTPPTGYKKVNTYNLPDSAIKDGSQYFDIDLYTGNGTTRNRIYNDFKPSFVWTKRRDATNNHYLTNRVTDGYLKSNLTDAETANSAFGWYDDGWDLGPNGSGSTYVGWSWRASDSAAVSNTDGTITSTVSANTTSGFSIITYTGTGSVGSVGHGLSVAPEIYIAKNRDATSNWYFHTTAIDGSSDYLWLNLTSAKSDQSAGWDADSTKINFAGLSTPANTSGNNHVIYAFHSVEGFSKFGSYTGNGSADGPFIYTGFSPSFVIIKRTNNTGNYCTFDNKRDGYNANDNYLYPNDTAAEVTSGGLIMDMVSNGFKCRSTQAGFNASGDTIIYMAFAENPFKNSLAR